MIENINKTSKFQSLSKSAFNSNISLANLKETTASTSVSLEAETNKKPALCISYQRFLATQK